MFRAISGIAIGVVVALPGSLLASGAAQPTASISFVASSLAPPGAWSSSFLACPSYAIPFSGAPPLPVPAESIYAQPSPAPPSGTVAPPPSTSPTRKTPVPQVTETRSFFRAYTVAPNLAANPSNNRCSVAFWNLTERDLVLQIDGQEIPVTRGKSLTLDLGRSFVWQVKGSEAQAENIPPSEAGMEIVIRR